MKSLEIPLGRRTRQYRFFEMLPALSSYATLLLLPILALWNTTAASMYLILIIFTMLIKAVGIGYHTIKGYNRMEAARKVDWHRRLEDLERPKRALEHWQSHSSKLFGHKYHLANLQRIADTPSKFMKPSQLRHIIIIAAYNESQEVIEPTLQSLLETTIDSKQLLIVFAYEERGGKEIAQTAEDFAKQYGKQFGLFYPVMHPKNLPNEVVGKGGNITYAGQHIDAKL